MAALERGPLGLNPLAEASGLPRATCHRLAVALEDHGLLRRDGEGRFCLGYRLVGLGRAAAAAAPLRDVARPVLEELRAETGESVQLYVREGDRRVCVLSLESAAELRTIVPEGAALSLERGSAGKILGAAHWPVEQSWAESVGEREAGVASVSAAVRDVAGVVVAAVSVSGPAERLGASPGERFGKQTAAAAASLSAALS
ncbi:MAG: putative IclR family transcriptional regulator [Acidimicrobiia bacterium]|nr:putative IclR family transcriptional regulator [Acidimicrobiia bacterium]